MDSRTEKLRARTKEFAIRIIRLFQALPQNKEAQIIGGQLLRCGTALERIIVPRAMQDPEQILFRRWA